MKRKMVLIITFMLFVVSLVISSPADAGVKIKKSDDQYIQLGFRFQGRLRLMNEADQNDVEVDDDKVSTGVLNGRDYNFDFRRLRIAVKGQLNKFIKFAAQTDLGGGTAQAGSDAIEWRDALVTLAFSKAANLSFGLFKIQLTRTRNGSGFGQMALDRPFVEATITDTADADGGIGGKRDQQVALHGALNKFYYRLAIGDGAKVKSLSGASAGLKDTLKFSGRFHYAFWDKEGFGYKETYHGKKKILTLGAGYTTQNDVAGSATAPESDTAMTVDLTYEKASAGGSVPNINAAYYTRDVGSSTSSSEGVGWHLTAGYLTPSKKFQPYIRYATWDTDATGKDKSVMNIGFNYLMKGHAAKIVLDWENIDFETNGGTKATDDHSIVTMQWQLDF